MTPDTNKIWTCNFVKLASCHSTRVTNALASANCAAIAVSAPKIVSAVARVSKNKNIKI
jgi:hypothetical protein